MKQNKKQYSLRRCESQKLEHNYGSTNVLQEQNPQQLINKMFDLNVGYLADKIKIGDVMKPSHHHYRKLGKIGKSEYKRKFMKTSLENYNQPYMQFKQIPYQRTMIDNYCSNYRHSFGKITQEFVNTDSKICQKKIINPSGNMSTQSKEGENLSKTVTRKNFNNQIKVDIKNIELEKSKLLKRSNKQAKQKALQVKSKPNETRKPQFFHQNNQPLSKIPQQQNDKKTIKLDDQRYKTSYGQSFNKGNKVCELQKSFKPKYKLTKGQSLQSKTQYSDSYYQKLGDKEVNKDKMMMTIDQLKAFITKGM